MRGAGAALGEIAADGRITTQPVPGTPAQIYELVNGPDGAIWFDLMVGGAFPRPLDTTQNLSGGRTMIARMTPDGTVTTYPMPDPSSVPNAIAFGPDGNLWIASAGPGEADHGL